MLSGFWKTPSLPLPLPLPPSRPPSLSSVGSEATFPFSWGALTGCTQWGISFTLFTAKVSSRCGEAAGPPLLPAGLPALHLLCISSRPACLHVSWSVSLRVRVSPPVCLCLVSCLSSLCIICIPCVSVCSSSVSPLSLSLSSPSLTASPLSLSLSLSVRLSLFDYLHFAGRLRRSLPAACRAALSASLPLCLPMKKKKRVKKV